MGALAAMEEAMGTGVVVVAHGYEQPAGLFNAPDEACDTSEGYGIRLAHSASQAPSEVDVAFKRARVLCEALEGTVLIPLCRAKTISEFREIRSRSFDNYAKLLMALSIFIKDSGIQHTEKSFALLSTNIDADHSLPWTVSRRDEVSFCLETLERAYALVADFVSRPAPPSKRTEDYTLASQFAFASLWAQLQVDCLVYAIHSNMQLSEEVLDSIIESLRTSVVAYSYARQAYDLRDDGAPLYADESWDTEDDTSAAVASHFGLGAQQ